MSGADGTEESGHVAIERWWPQLSIESKHRLLAELGGEIDATTASEIASITGAASPQRLSEAEQQFVRTQIEPVD